MEEPTNPVAYLSDHITSGGSVKAGIVHGWEPLYAPPFRVARLHPDAILPKRQTPGSAGYDLCTIADVTLEAGKRHTIRTGLIMEIPRGCYGRIAPRSGLAVKFGLDTMAGVIDSDYRGEIGIVAVNLGQADVSFKRGDRIAQLILERCYTPVVTPISVEDLTGTDRGKGGFGSTGESAK